MYRLMIAFSAILISACNDSETPLTKPQQDISIICEVNDGEFDVIDLKGDKLVPRRRTSHTSDVIKTEIQDTEVKYTLLNRNGTLQQLKVVFSDKAIYVGDGENSELELKEHCNLL